jgi:probable F420-dependent oxidoreductase
MMKFSVSLPGPSDHPDAAEIDDLVAVVQAVERVGLNAVSGSDHPFPLVIHGQAGHQALDPFVMLSYFGAATERIAMHLSLIVVPYRNPFVVARMLATLDLMTRGRVIAALGAGYMRAEFDALGADFEGRGDQVVDSVAAMRAAWTGEPLTLEGTGWRAEGNTMRPMPFTSPHPILWRGGNSRKAIEQAVADYDGWAPFEVGGDGSLQTSTSALSLQTLPAHLARFWDEVDRAGRSRPIDICYVRTSRQWLQDPELVVEDLQVMSELGLTWLEFRIGGRSRAERIEGIEAFAESAVRAGVR